MPWLWCGYRGKMMMREDRKESFVRFPNARRRHCLYPTSSRQPWHSSLTSEFAHLKWLFDCHLRLPFVLMVPSSIDSLNFLWMLWYQAHFLHWVVDQCPLGLNLIPILHLCSCHDQYIWVSIWIIRNPNLPSGKQRLSLSFVIRWKCQTLFWNIRMYNNPIDICIKEIFSNTYCRMFQTQTFITIIRKRNMVQIWIMEGLNNAHCKILYIKKHYDSTEAYD